MDIPNWNQSGCENTYRYKLNPDQQKNMERKKEQEKAKKALGVISTHTFS